MENERRQKMVGDFLRPLVKVWQTLAVVQQTLENSDSFQRLMVRQFDDERVKFEKGL